MSLLSNLREELASIDEMLATLREKAKDGADLAELAGGLLLARTKRELLAERIASVEAAERERAAASADKAAERERANAEKDLQRRRAELSARWAAWGKEMTALDAALPGLWADYRSMAAAALELAKDAAALGVQLPGPDTGPAVDVLARIVSGLSGIRDRRQ